MTSMNCRSCGAPLEGDSLSKQWNCSYCGSTNINEKVLDQYLKKIDLVKAGNYFKLGINAWESNNYTEALNYFNKVLEENAKMPEGWIYRGLCIARTLKWDDLFAQMKQYEMCFAQAETLEPNSELLQYGRELASELLLEKLLELMSYRLKEAEKIKFAYSSVDKATASNKTEEQLEIFFDLANVAIDIESSNDGLNYKCIDLILQADKQSKKSPKELVRKAKIRMNEFRAKPKYAEFQRDQATNGIAEIKGRTPIGKIKVPTIVTNILIVLLLIIIMPLLTSVPFLSLVVNIPIFVIAFGYLFISKIQAQLIKIFKLKEPNWSSKLAAILLLIWSLLLIMISVALISEAK